MGKRGAKKGFLPHMRERARQVVPGKGRYDQDEIVEEIRRAAVRGER